MYQKRNPTWEEYLSYLEYAYNSSKDSANGFSLFILMYGFQPRSPIAVGLEKEKLQSISSLKTCKACCRLHATTYVVFKFEPEFMLIKVNIRSLSMKVTWSF